MPRPTCGSEMGWLVSPAFPIAELVCAGDNGPSPAARPLPLRSGRWIPAFAGMTAGGVPEGAVPTIIPASAGMTAPTRVPSFPRRRGSILPSFPRRRESMGVRRSGMAERRTRQLPASVPLPQRRRGFIPPSFPRRRGSILPSFPRRRESMGVRRSGMAERRTRQLPASVPLPQRRRDSILPSFPRRRESMGFAAGDGWRERPLVCAKEPVHDRIGATLVP